MILNTFLEKKKQMGDYKIILFLILFLFINPVYSGIYKWIDNNGKVHFSSKKPRQQKVEEIKLRVIKSRKTVAISKSNHSINSEKVVIYSTEWCGYCKKAKKYFRKNNIKFIEYDIEKNNNARKRYDAMGETGVPVILVNNKKMTGFSVDGFKEIYP